MIGKWVEIDFPESFYDTMRGTIVEETPKTYLVKIDLGNKTHLVMFYKNKVFEYND